MYEATDRLVKAKYKERGQKFATFKLVKGFLREKH